MQRRLLGLIIFYLSMALPLVGCEVSELSKVPETVGVNPETSTMMIVCLEDGKEWAWNKKRLDIPYSPASTTKISHTLIALEEGYVEGPDAVFEWDGKVRSLEAWNQNLTLRSAYKYSAKWIYEIITQGLGHEVMSKWIDRLEFGNRYIGEPKDIANYWV